MKRSEEVVAGLLAKKLKDHGVRRLFGIPGGPSIPLLKALSDEGIDFILTSHESSAAVMADVTARLSGVTGICHSTFGPGATNLSTGVGGALLDRSPLIALTTVVTDEWAGRTTQMNIDHQALYKPLTKATFRMTLGNAPDMIDEAIVIANEEYPGPVHIALPADISEKKALSTASTTKSTGVKTNPDEELINKVLKLIDSSGSPVIAIGLTAARLGLYDKIAAFLKEKPVPVVVTPMAKGVIDYNNPCLAGVLFHALSDRLKHLTNEADLIIGLGYDPVEYNYESWVPDIPVIHFGTVSCDLPGERYTQIISSSESWFAFLDGLNTSIKMMSLAEEVRTAIRGKFSEHYDGFSPVEAINILNEVLPDDAIVTADVGSHLHLLGQQWQVSSQGRFIITNGWSSMGFGLSALIAAAFENPGKPVVCITGDGGMMMSAGEILTARRYGLKIIVIVFADRQLNLIKLKEEGKGLAPMGINLYTGSLFGGESFLGVRVLHASTAAALKKYVGEALRTDASVIIETGIDPAAYSQLILV